MFIKKISAITLNATIEAARLGEGGRGTSATGSAALRALASVQARAKEGGRLK